MERRVILAAACAALLAGCATYEPTVPPGYTGPTAVIWDGMERESSAKGALFYVESVDGKPVQTSMDLTRKATHGKGFSLYMQMAYHDVPARPLKLRVVGTHVTGAPIHEFFSTISGNFQTVRGELAFTPEGGKAYVVRGRLSRDGSAVWIADKDSGERVSEEIDDKPKKPKS